MPICICVHVAVFTLSEISRRCLYFWRISIVVFPFFSIIPVVPLSSTVDSMLIALVSFATHGTQLFLSVSCQISSLLFVSRPLVSMLCVLCILYLRIVFVYFRLVCHVLCFIRRFYNYYHSNESLASVMLRKLFIYWVPCKEFLIMPLITSHFFMHLLF